MVEDVRDRIAALVDAIVPLDDLEVGHKHEAGQWIGSGAEIFRLAKPATPPKHLVSYCVLVDTAGQQALLVDHRDAQRWLPTGGHVDVGEDPADAARREIFEELGSRPDFHSSLGAAPLMVTVTNTVGRSESHTDVSLWFVFEGAVDQALAPDEGEFADSRWWNFADIKHGPNTRFDPHLPRFIDKLRQLESTTLVTR